MRILVLIDHYLPGQAMGGPVRSVANLVEALGNDLSFSIVTRDHDMGSPIRYANIESGDWNAVGNAEVLYLSNARIFVFGLWSILLRTPYDVLYLNSAFAPAFGIVPMLLRKCRLIPRRPVIVASRGQFSSGALALKGFKKRCFLALARFFRLYRQPLVTWQASTAQEESEIREVLQHAGFVPRTRVALNPLQHRRPCDRRTEDSDLQVPVFTRARKVTGRLDAVFLSRISPKKNLLGLLNALKTVRGSVCLTIYGPIEDADYWKSCHAVIDELPADIRVHYGGIVENSSVGCTLSQHQLFAFPTFGENFGHVIAEALMAGCPVLTTDATPWKDIEGCGAGTILRGTATADIAAAIQRHVNMDDAAHRRMCEAANALGERRADDPETVAQNRALFINAACEAHS